MAWLGFRFELEDQLVDLAVDPKGGIDFLDTSFPSTESTPVPPLPSSGPIRLEVEHDRTLAGI